MRKGATVFRLVCAMVALQALFPLASLAAEEEAPVGQEGEGRWVPSLAISSGVFVQQHSGQADSVLSRGTSPPPIPLQGFVDGDDLAVAPFVGGSLELMTPAVPIPTRPRLFLSGEILPSFATERDVALDGAPGCIRSPLPFSPCAVDLVDFPPATFSEAAANGEGTRTTAQIDTLIYGASMGVSFPARIGKRQLRIKPSFGWINYKVDATGIVVDAACSPTSRCIPSSPSPPAVVPGFLRQTILTGSDSQRFNAIGPGLDIEMDTGRFGPLGVSLFLGGRAYRVMGDRTIAFSDSQAYSDLVGNDVASAEWEVDVDPWVYRGHVGIRFQWLGSGN